MENSSPEIDIDPQALSWLPLQHIHPDQLTPDSLVRVVDENGEEYIFRLMPAGQTYYLERYEDGYLQNVKDRTDSLAIQPILPGKEMPSLTMLWGAQNRFVVDRVLPKQKAGVTTKDAKAFWGFPYGGFRKGSPLVLMSSSYTFQEIDHISLLEAVNIHPKSSLEQTLMEFMSMYLSDHVRGQLNRLYAPNGLSPHPNIVPESGQPIYFDTKTFDHHVADVAYYLYQLAQSPESIRVNTHLLEEICQTVQQYVELHTFDICLSVRTYDARFCLPDSRGNMKYYHLSFSVDLGAGMIRDFSLNNDQ